MPVKSTFKASQFDFINPSTNLTSISPYTQNLSSTTSLNIIRENRKLHFNRITADLKYSKALLY